MLSVVSFVTLFVAAITNAKTPMPWNYTGYDQFPAFFFGASPKGLESTSVMTLAAKHQIAGWGWQQNNTGLPEEEQNLYNQAVGFNKFYMNTSNVMARNTQSTFVYRSGSSANPFWKSVYNITNDTNYRDFWVQNDNGQVCYGLLTPLYNDLPSGPLFNFSNVTAGKYYLNHVIKEIVTDYPYINSVFFDLCDWLYCDYNWKQWTNCSNYDGLNDQQKVEMGMAAINIFVQAAEILNNAGIIPIYSFGTLLNDNPEKLMDTYTECKVSEEVWIDALSNVTWIRYQEYWPDIRANSAANLSMNNSASVINMLYELQYELPIQVHAYGVAPNATLDPYFYGSFLMMQQDYSYFSCSNGWFDDNFSWHKSYDNVYGKPLDAPQKINDDEYFRQFEKCNLTINIKERTANFVWV